MSIFIACPWLRFFPTVVPHRYVGRCRHHIGVYTRTFAPCFPYFFQPRRAILRDLNILLVSSVWIEEDEMVSLGRENGRRRTGPRVVVDVWLIRYEWRIHDRSAWKYWEMTALDTSVRVHSAHGWRWLR